jgi:hypothetical protein
MSLLVGLFYHTCGENILFSFTSLTVSSFMINEIARMPKTTGKKKVSQKNIELINNANRVAACLVDKVNKVGRGQKKFKSLEEMKQHMAKEAESNKRTNARESSEEDEDDDL